LTEGGAWGIIQGLMEEVLSLEESAKFRLAAFHFRQEKAFRFRGRIVTS